MCAVADAAPPPDASNAGRVRWEFEMLNRHDVSPLKEHLVASVFNATDGMELARQFGLLPKDGSPADKALKAAFNTKTRLAQKFRR
jgi:hypothetical protein